MNDSDSIWYAQMRRMGEESLVKLQRALGLAPIAPIAPVSLLDLKARIYVLSRGMPMHKSADGQVASLESRMACAPLAMLGYLHAVQYNPFYKRASR